MSASGSARQSSMGNSSARQSSLGKPAVESSIPSILQAPVENVDYTFQLRDCKLMVFHEVLDKNSSTVYDLMYAVAKKHGDTIEPDKVQIFTKVNDDEYRPINDISQKLSELEEIDTFYYDFTPISGSLLIIPNEK
ncbi:hypothetical protein M9Y10_038949 [Tritrichomonas musculus]|uniref:Uncharacterized protein n=1 Tax=Tritrichomonas musculus TaxID=1915356 RepID=A0ABR2K9V3_9EUKA